MKKILAFAGSNSSTSINHRFLTYVTGRFSGHEVKVIKLRDFDIPMFGVDAEKEKGFPIDIKVLKNLIDEHEALVIAVNENNGTVSAFFKNVIDWLSRLDRTFLKDRKILLISTSPGRRGAASSLAYAKGIFPRFGGDVIESFSFPSFNDNFIDEKVPDELLFMGIEEVVNNFEQEIEA